jgi:hypothetical protein
MTPELGSEHVRNTGRDATACAAEEADPAGPTNLRIKTCFAVSVLLYNYRIHQLQNPLNKLLPTTQIHPLNKLHPNLDLINTPSKSYSFLLTQI